VDTTDPRLLLVGGIAPNLQLLANLLESHGYACESALGLEGFDDALASNATFDLALVDVSGMNASVWKRCERPNERAVRLLVISPRQSASMQQQSIAHGAQSVLVKPLVVRELVELIRTLLTV
jgi:DNA-binding response OmpR family regulator